MSRLNNQLINGLNFHDDEVLEVVIKKAVDTQLKKKWINKMELDFGVTRNIKPEMQKRTFIINWKLISSVAATILIVVSAVLIIESNVLDSKQLAMNYLENTEVFHPGITKGVFQDIDYRNQAIQAFNDKNYNAALKNFNQIEEKTQEDFYYLGLAGLFENDVNTAIMYFQDLEANQSLYSESSRWYLALSFIMKGEPVKAKEYLVKIKKHHWNYSKAQKLIKTID